MFEYYRTYQLFNEDDLKEIDALLQNDNDLFWENGLNSTGHKNTNIKKNLELLSSTELFKNLNSLVKKIIYNNNKFTNFTIPLKSTKCIFSKTPIGGYYNLHHDSSDIGDFSTTIFLSNKNDYDGGELLLKIGSDIKSIKLEKGYAVTYNTGIPHAVSKVTRGERIVGILWTTTIIKNYNLRYIYTNISEIEDIINKKYPEEIEFFNNHKDIYSVDENILFKIKYLKEYIERCFFQN